MSLFVVSCCLYSVCVLLNHPLLTCPGRGSSCPAGAAVVLTGAAVVLTGAVVVLQEQ